MALPLMVDAASVFLRKQFFDTVPVSIEEAARMDGAPTLQTFWYVVLPMARPALITLTILSFQGSWDEFGHVHVTTSSPEHKTLVTGLADLTAGGLGAGTQYPLKMATALITTIPVAVLFFAFRSTSCAANDGAVKGRLCPDCPQRQVPMPRGRALLIGGAAGSDDDTWKNQSRDQQNAR